MNTPHTHPRATEMLYLVNGTIEAGMLTENGARFVYNTITAGSAAVFLKVRIAALQCMPRVANLRPSSSLLLGIYSLPAELGLRTGAIRRQVHSSIVIPMGGRPNDRLSIAALNNEDPGVLSAAQRCMCLFCGLTLARC